MDLCKERGSVTGSRKEIVSVSKLNKEEYRRRYEKLRKQWSREGGRNKRLRGGSLLLVITHSNVTVFLVLPK